MKGSSDPQCVNCQGKHPANYKGCPKMLEYKKNDAKSKTRSDRKPKNPATNHYKQRSAMKEVNGVAFRNSQPTNRKLDFAGALRGDSNERVHGVNWMGLPTSQPTDRGLPKVSNNAYSGFQNNSGAGSFNFIANEINTLFGVSFVEMINTINKFLPIYNQCQDSTQKKMLLIEFMFQVSR